MTTVLFVCTANVCRSPAAAALWARAARRSRWPGEVLSAGVRARLGQPAHPVMVSLLKDYGCDLANHTATPFTGRLARRADLVLVMEAEHARSVVNAAPELAGRVMLLGHWGEGPVLDPVGRARADYIDCLEQMECAMESWMDHLQQRAAPRVACA